MLLNRAERAVMTSRPWALLERRYAGSLLGRLGADLLDRDVLEIGCGSGGFTEALLDDFAARSVHAIDVDPRMVELTRRRLASRLGERVTVEPGDALALPIDTGGIDAVVELGIFHHIPDWRAAVAEVARVLRPEGQFVFAEVTRHALDRPTYRLLFDHPREDRFTAEDFADALAGQGLAIVRPIELRFFGDFVFGVAIRR